MCFSAALTHPLLVLLTNEHLHGILDSSYEDEKRAGAKENLEVMRSGAFLLLCCEGLVSSGVLLLGNLLVRYEVARGTVLLHLKTLFQHCSCQTHNSLCTPKTCTVHKKKHLSNV